MKTVFKVLAGGFTIASSLDLLIRNSTYDELIRAVNTCVLPAGANLIHITEGCLCLKVQLMDISALETLWRLYKDGTLKASLQALFDTDEIREFAGGEHVEVIVTIDEREYDKARSELELPQGKDGKKRRQYLDEEKFSNILKYLEESETNSATTEASDSGMRESCSISSELETDESIDSPPTLYLKDLSKELVEELTFRLQSDPVALKRFYQSFGLDPEKLYAKGFQTIAEIFPGTPIKTLKDVFKALKLLDLVDLLEDVTKLRALRPALSMKEIEMLPSANYRAIKDYSKAEILIIDCHNDASTENDAERTASFFQAFNSKSQVTTLTAAKALVDLLENLAKLRARMMMKETDALMAETRETMLKVFLEEKIPDKRSGGLNRKWNETVAEQNEQLLSLFHEEESAMRTELRALVEKREQWANERMLMIEEIEQEEEKLKRESEKFAATVLSFIEKWMTLPLDEGEESTLFVVLVREGFKINSYSDDVENFMKMIGECVRKTLSLIPGAKLLIANNSSCLAEKEEIPCETLQVYSPERIGLTTMLDLLKKRWQTLDLISVMQELKRSLRAEGISRKQEETTKLWDRNTQLVEIQENLSRLPRLQKTE